MAAGPGIHPPCHPASHLAVTRLTERPSARLVPPPRKRTLRVTGSPYAPQSGRHYLVLFLPEPARPGPGTESGGGAGPPHRTPSAELCRPWSPRGECLLGPRPRALSLHRKTMLPPNQKPENGRLQRPERPVRSPRGPCSTAPQARGQRVWEAGDAAALLPTAMTGSDVKTGENPIHRPQQGSGREASDPAEAKAGWFRPGRSRRAEAPAERGGPSVASQATVGLGRGASVSFPSLVYCGRSHALPSPSLPSSTCLLCVQLGGGRPYESGFRRQDARRAAAGSAQ